MMPQSPEHTHVYRRMRRYYIVAVIIVIIATVVLVAGVRHNSKYTADRRLAVRAEELSRDIEWHLQKTGSLPTSLGEVDTDVDLEGIIHEYVDSSRYRLCMTFLTADQSVLYTEKEPAYLNAVNNHPAGHYCYTIRPVSPKNIKPLLIDPTR